MKRTTPPTLRDHARSLRRNQTDAEKLLWRALRNRRLGNVKFRRQVIVRSMIVDFLSYQPPIAIEVDGGQHANNPADMRRDALLRALGFHVLRFWNTEVLSKPGGCLVGNRENGPRRSHRPSPQPSPKGRGGADASDTDEWRRRNRR